MVSPKNLNDKINVDETQIEQGTSLFEDSMRKFRKNKMAVVSCVIIVLLFMTSIFAKFITPYSYDEATLESQNFPPTWYVSFMSEEHKSKVREWFSSSEANTEEFDLFANNADVNEDEEASEEPQELDLTQLGVSESEAPVGLGFFDSSINHLSAEAAKKYFSMKKTAHLLGTDELGQDILSRLVYGIRLSLFLALTVTIVSLIVGVSYGSVAGYVGGTIDQLMMRFVDFLFGVPFIFLIILLMVLFGRHVFLIFIGLGLVYWIVLARIVRGQILSIKEKEFVMAAKSNGVSERKIIFKHLVPNVVGPVIIFATLLVPQIMLLEAFLSFIGLGVTPPDVSLGIMISDGASVLSNYSWPIIFPGIVFSVMIFCMNFIGDGLRDALDPKLK